MTQPLHQPKAVVDITVGEAGGNALSFRTLYCTFEIKYWATRKPDSATVTIANLSEDTARYLERPNLVLTINAGDDVPGQLFQGGINRDGVVTGSRLQEGTTTIKAASGRRTYRDTPFVRSYPQGASVYTRILPDIAAAMGKPLRVTADIPPDLRTYTIETGWNFVHPARDALTEVLLPFGLDWTLTGGVLYIVDPLKALPGNAPLISPETGLHDHVERTKKGCKFRCDLNPAIIVSQASVVRSEGWSGTIRNEQVMHRGNSWATEWWTKAQGDSV